MLFLIASLLLSLAATASACSCLEVHAQNQVCRERSAVALVEVKSQDIVRIYGGPEKVVVINGTSSPANFEEVRSFRYRLDHDIEADSVRYGIYLIQAFQGSCSSPTPPYHGYLYTALESSLCGTTLSLDETYIVFGSTDKEGRFQVSSCSKVIHWNPLSDSEKSNIQKGLYKAVSACFAGCEVVPCRPWMTEEECLLQSPKECLWTSLTTYQDGHEENFPSRLCVSTSDENTACEWDGGDSTE